MFFAFVNHCRQRGDFVILLSLSPNGCPLLPSLFHALLPGQLLERSQERLFFLLEAPEQASVSLEGSIGEPFTVGLGVRCCAALEM